MRVHRYVSVVRDITRMIERVEALQSRINCMEANSYITEAKQLLGKALVPLMSHINGGDIQE